MDSPTLRKKVDTLELTGQEWRTIRVWKLCYNIPELCAATGIGKTQIYKALSEGELKSVFTAGRRLVLTEDAIEWLLSGRNASPADDHQDGE